MTPKAGFKKNGMNNIWIIGSINHAKNFTIVFVNSALEIQYQTL
jgi:hypothetical protein